MKNLRMSLFAAVAIIMGIAASAFTTKEVPAKSSNLQYFYEYTSSSTAQSDIQNIANYARASDDCTGSNHVCGVYLPTNKPLGQQPVASEFNAEKSDLWDSEQAGASVDPGVIKMRN